MGKFPNPRPFTFDFCFYFFIFVFFIILKLIYFIKNKTIMIFYKLFIVKNILIILLLILKYKIK